MSLRLHLAGLLAALLAACGGAGDGASGVRVIGGPGGADGRFITPRSVSVAAGRLWVADRSGRVQCLDLEGRHLLTARVESPETRGFPVGVTALDDGGCLVCDTHASRVLRLDADGRQVLAFGRYGPGHGEFTYPERAAVSDGRWFISEYGEGAANRVQVFETAGDFVRAFGSYGHGPGQFTRCIGLALLGDEVFVADVSDRIIVYSLQGRFLREFGRSGTSPGELRYPYGLCIHDGLLCVAEYGNNRVQRFTPDGETRGCFGRAGRAPGEFSGPWDVCSDGRFLYVADTGNHRVQVIDSADVTWHTGAP